MKTVVIPTTRYTHFRFCVLAEQWIQQIEETSYYILKIRFDLIDINMHWKLHKTITYKIHLLCDNFKKTLKVDDPFNSLGATNRWYPFTS